MDNSSTIFKNSFLRETKLVFSVAISRKTGEKWLKKHKN